MKIVVLSIGQNWDKSSIHKETNIKDVSLDKGTNKPEEEKDGSD